PRQKPEKDLSARSENRRQLILNDPARLREVVVAITWQSPPPLLRQKRQCYVDGRRPLRIVRQREFDVARKDDLRDRIVFLLLMEPRRGHQVQRIVRTDRATVKLDGDALIEKLTKRSGDVPNELGSDGIRPSAAAGFVLLESIRL